MPPIPQQGSRAGLITALVIFTILFVTATVFAFINSARATRAEEDFRNFQKEAAGVYARNALTGPDLDTLKAARSTEGFTATTPLIDVSIAQTKALATLLGGNSSAAAGTASRTFAAAKEKLKATDVKLGNDLPGAVTLLADAVLARDAQVAQLNAQVTQTAGQVTAAKEQQTALIAANDQAVQEAREQATKAAADAAALSATSGQQVQLIETERDEERKKLAADADQLRNQIAEKDGAIKTLQADITAIRQRLASLRGNTTDALVRQSDGSIIRLPGEGIAYVDLGAGDQIAPGLTFEVYDKADGVPALGNESTDLPQGKASVEVLRVGSTSSECRITRLTPGEQLTEGDLIANLVYDRNTRYTFHVFGNFDLDQNNVPTAGDANVIKQLITQWGGKIGDVVNVNTDFVVLGVEPVVPTYNEGDPVEKKKFDDATAALTAYQDVLQKAGELNIPVLNQNRFLYYVGYFEQAKR